MRAWKIINNVVLGLIILFSLLLIATSLNLFGSKMYVVQSGSMEPAIHTGSVVITKPKESYSIGDIITFKIASSKDTVTHRIVELKNDAQDKLYYVVQGDANAVPDADYVSASNVLGITIFSIPLIGYLIAFIKTLPGLIAFIIIPATIIIYHELTNINTEIANIKAAKRKVVHEVEVIEDTAKEVLDELVQEEKKLVSMISKSPPKKGVRRVN